MRTVLIADTSREIQASAPPDIAEQFRAVLKAVDTAAGRLKPDAKVRDVVNPLYGEHVLPAFDADDYDCDAADG